MEPVVRSITPIRVLIVEDETLICDWVEQSLEDQGFAVDTASNAADALRRLGRGGIDVLLTDINLPSGMDGTLLARRARELQPKIFVIYASAQTKLLGPNISVPGAIFMPKPYDPALVGRIVTAAFAPARQARQSRHVRAHARRVQRQTA